MNEINEINEAGLNEAGLRPTLARASRLAEDLGDLEDLLGGAGADAADAVNDALYAIRDALDETGREDGESDAEYAAHLAHQLVEARASTDDVLTGLAALRKRLEAAEARVGEMAVAIDEAAKAIATAAAAAASGGRS